MNLYKKSSTTRSTLVSYGRMSAKTRSAKTNPNSSPCSLFLILFQQIKSAFEFHGSLTLTRYLLLLPLLLCASAQAAASDGEDISAHYRFINVGPEFLESKDPQRAIIQDGKGFMWFGSYDGLIRYDGVDFKLFTHTNEDSTSLSNTNVKALAVDTQGVLWVGTLHGLNRYDPTTESFTRFINPAPEPLGTKVNEISGLAIGNEGLVWMTSFTGGLSSLDPRTGQFQHYQHEEGNLNSLPTDNVICVLNDSGKGLWIGTTMPIASYFDYASKKFTHYSLNDIDAQVISSKSTSSMAIDLRSNLWVATKDGIVKLDLRTSRSKRYSANNKNDNLISSNFFDVKVDSQGKVWAASEGGGLSLYQPDTDSFINFLNNPAIANSLPTNKVWTIFISKTDDIWLGHFPHGVSMVDAYAKAFKNYTTTSGALSLSNSEVLALAEDGHKTLWVGTENGLNQLDFNSNQAKHFIHNAKDPTSIPARAVTSTLLDSKGILWVGTWNGGVCHFNRQTGQCVKVTSNIDELKGTSIIQITEDSVGDVWLASSNGLYQYHRATADFSQYVASKTDSTTLAGNYVRAVKEDHLHNIWVGTEHGLDLFDRKSNTFSHHKHADKDPRSLGSNAVRAIFEDSHGNLWVGLWGGGLNLYHRDTNDFTIYTVKDGLTSNSILGITENSNGDLWISTNNGLTQFNPVNHAAINYGKEHGLAGTSFKPNSILRSHSGELFIGGTHGITAFTPGNIFKNTAVPPIRLTNLSLFSQPVYFGDKNSPLTHPIGETPLLTLDNTQTVFSIDFAALDFKIPTRNQYRYRLKGFEDSWQDAGYRHSATYTNIDPGNYVFQVTGSNNDGVWNTQGASLNIRILPPWWKSWWAYTLYCFTVLGLASALFWQQRRKRQIVEEQNAILEIRVAERTAEVTAKTTEVIEKSRDMHVMLSNIPQGLFTIQANGLIHPEYSAYLESIFETTQIADCNAYDFLFNSAKIDNDTLDAAKAAMNSIVGENEMNFDFNQALLIGEYAIEKSEKIKILSLSWNPIVDGDLVNRLMVSVRDVTEMKQLENAARKQQRQLDIVSQLLGLSAEKYLEFEASCNQQLHLCIDTIKSADQPDKGILALLFRNMHTLKGSSRTYGFSHLSNIAHTIESAYSELMEAQSEAIDSHSLESKPDSDDESRWDRESLLRDLDMLQSILTEYSHIFRSVLGRDTDSRNKRQDGLWIDNSTLATIQTFIDAREYDQLKKYVLQLNTLSIEETLVDIIAALPAIAEQLDKAPATVIIAPNSVRLKPQAHSLVKNVFSHILRNCIDHGIESTEDRLRANKKADGEIRIRAWVVNDNLNIGIRDNGRGLNLGELFNKGVALDLWKESDQPEPLEIANLIFHSGVTTKKFVTDISGRGVGMDAVKQFLIEAGGDASLILDPAVTEPNDYREFELMITLPKEYFITL